MRPIRVNERICAMSDSDISEPIWFYAKSNQRFGPVTLEAMRDLAASGRLAPGDLVWRAGWPNWLPAEQATDLRDAFAPAPRPHAAPPQGPVLQYGHPSAAVVGSLAPAGFWLRFAAAMIDGLVLCFAWCGGFTCVMTILAIGHRGRIVSEDGGVSWFIAMLIGWLYHALMEASPVQGSLGKMAVGLMVTDEHGRRIGFARATGRHFGKMISGMIMMIGFMMAGWTEKKQALHDMMAGTLVVRRVA
jgi:uncharacterized RDD family membrane protein YckC